MRYKLKSLAALQISASSPRGDLKKSITNIASECRSANIVRDHAVSLPEDATPKPDGIFGKDSTDDSGSSRPSTTPGWRRRCRPSHPQLSRQRTVVEPWRHILEVL